MGIAQPPLEQHAVDAYKMAREPDLQLVQPGDALRQGSDAIVAGQREVCHIGQLLHSLREVQQPPLILISLALPLWRLVAVQHNLLQLL